MLILDAMEHIYKIFDQDTGDLDIESDDFLVRMSKFNESINLWETFEKGILWNELYKTASGNTAAADSTIDLPADFIFPAGYLRITDTNGIVKYELKKAKDFQEIERLDANRRIFYLTGGDGARVANVNPAPTAIFPYKLDYYAHAHTYTAGDDDEPIQMSDPWFGIHYVLAWLYADDENTTLAAVHTQIYTQKGAAMVTRNEVSTWYENDELPDSQGGGFGI